MAANDVPAELKPLWKIFERLAYRHDYSTVFQDVLGVTLTQFTPPGNEFMEKLHADSIRRYDDKEKQLVNQWIRELVLTYDRQIDGDRVKWYDPLGDFYMALRSNYKGSALGQFFTPADLVDTMTHFTDINTDKANGLRVNDPAAGSGRTLLSFHAHYPGNFVYAEDIDWICCMMCIVNMLFHGCRGEVVHHDSLAMKPGRAFAITPHPWLHPIPYVIEVAYEGTVIASQLKSKPVEKPVNKKPAENKQLKATPGVQLKLF